MWTELPQSLDFSQIVDLLNAEIFLLHSFASIKLSINATLDLKHFRERTLTDLPMRLEIYPRKRK
jgi:hypothetical protein